MKKNFVVVTGNLSLISLFFKQLFVVLPVFRHLFYLAT